MLIIIPMQLTTVVSSTSTQLLKLGADRVGCTLICEILLKCDRYYRICSTNNLFGVQEQRVTRVCEGEAVVLSSWHERMRTSDCVGQAWGFGLPSLLQGLAFLAVTIAISEGSKGAVFAHAAQIMRLILDGYMALIHHDMLCT